MGNLIDEANDRFQQAADIRTAYNELDRLKAPVLRGVADLNHIEPSTKANMMRALMADRYGDEWLAQLDAAPTSKRTPERERYLALLLACAIEHGGYGFPGVVEWHCPAERYGEWFAIIFDRYDIDEDKYSSWEAAANDAPSFRVDLDTMARGPGIIRRAFWATAEDGNTYMHNAETFERLGFGGDERTQLLLSDRTNADDGDYDVIGALAVLECSLYGAVIYG